MNIPQLGEQLNDQHIAFLNAFSKSCRSSIIKMVVNANSGHPGGALSCIDYLSLLYTFVLSQTGEKIVVSNGHISPGVYAVLAEMNYIPKDDVVKEFRQVDSIYEGHVARHVPGIFYGTGPLGAGVSAATGFCIAENVMATNENRKKEKVFALLGDGEAQEGQVYEMMNFASAHKLDNFIVFMDYNKVQLSGSIDEVMPFDVKGYFEVAGWHVIDVDGHDFNAMWEALNEAYLIEGKPILLLGNTIMGKGAGEMEKDGAEYKSTWHGKAPSAEMANKVLAEIALSEQESQLITEFLPLITWNPEKPVFKKTGDLMDINIGNQKVYGVDDFTDCRSAYGNALQDLGRLNSDIIVFNADLMGSVKTGAFSKDNPLRSFECGIAEQQMVSAAGGASLNGMIPFASTFGAFISSRAKDQARVNDINQANTKLVATHCGLSVGEDGPTHQAIDDMGSFGGLFNTVVLEPADPNLCDRMIRYIASHYGNFYVRMGRHKLPILTKEDGSVFFDENYVFEPGKFNLYRQGKNITIIASGPMVTLVELAVKDLTNISVEIIIANGPSILDEELIMQSARKTGHLITIEDHNIYTGIGANILTMLSENDVHVSTIRMGVTEYQLSGKPQELYVKAGMGIDSIKAKIQSMVG